MRSYNPHGARPTGLGCSLFARHYSGNHVCFLFLLLLRCFSSEGWLTLRCDMPSAYRVVPFGNLRIYRSCAAPRSLSQLTTSFFVSKSQGIHHTPLSALKELLLFLLLVSLQLFTSNMSKNFVYHPSMINQPDVTIMNRLTQGLHPEKELKKVEDIGVEPMTLCVQGRCSSQLS